MWLNASFIAFGQQVGRLLAYHPADVHKQRFFHIELKIVAKFFLIQLLTGLASLIEKLSGSVSFSGSPYPRIDTI